jgi:transposase
MGAVIDLTDQEWDQVADLFDPPGRRGAPEVYPRRLMVEAMLWMARTGIQWRYLPARFPPWTAVWSQWRRWRANTVWEKAMGRLARTIRMDQDRHPEPSMLMVDAQTAKGGRAGPTFHDAGGRGGRTFGSKRTILVDILGLPFACRVDPARPHDVASARLLLTDELPALPRLRAVVADRAYRGLGRLAAKRGLALDIKAPPKGLSRFVPIRPLYKVEHAFAQLGRWRRLSRCYKQTEASAQAWLGVAALGYLFARMRVEPA